MNKRIEVFKKVFDDEIKSLKRVKECINNNTILKVLEIMDNLNGNVIITGIGKSGLIGKKIAATFTSVGIPSIYIHPVEALHGDMGIVKISDMILAITYSGETREILDFIRKFIGKIPIIAITGNDKSSLSKLSNFTININIGNEACPLKLSPTSSSTATLVLGDAIAITLMYIHSFTKEDYAKNHPGGSLGRSLLRIVQDDMITENLPIVSDSSTIFEIIPVMTESRVGLVIVQNIEENILGVFTDGDLRRLLQKGKSCLDDKVVKHCSINPKKVSPNTLVIEAEAMMKNNKITSLLVVEDNEIKGILQIFN